MNFVPLYMMRRDKNREKPVPYSTLFRNKKLWKNSSESAKELFQAFVCVCVSKVLTLANFHCNLSLKPRRTSSVGHNASTCVGWLAENENFHALKKTRNSQRKTQFNIQRKTLQYEKKLFSRFSSFLLFSRHTEKRVSWAHENVWLEQKHSAQGECSVRKLSLDPPVSV